MANAIVLVIDRLGSSYLGPYGNTWIDTPAWNRLAAQSILFETALADSPDLLAAYHSYWQGRHAASARHTRDVPLLAQRLGSTIDSWLVTDEPLVNQHAGAEGFRNRVLLPSDIPAQAALTIEDTQIARVFAAAIETVQQARSPYLVWIHVRAMDGIWDAPYEMRGIFAEEGDPDPPRWLLPPECLLPRDFDPDELLGILHAYSGQAAVLDVCLGILLDTLWSGSTSDATALFVTSPRGFPIGEHQYVGRENCALHAELIQVPWLMHSTGFSPARHHDLIQPPDLYPTLLEWFDTAPPDESIWGRSLLPQHLDRDDAICRNQACSITDQQQAIRIPHWFLRQHPDDQKHLFAKPDDRWEVNEISDRCPAEVEELTQAMDGFLGVAAADRREDLPKLPPALLRNHV